MRAFVELQFVGNNHHSQAHGHGRKCCCGVILLHEALGYTPTLLRFEPRCVAPSPLSSRVRLVAVVMGLFPAMGLPATLFTPLAASGENTFRPLSFALSVAVDGKCWRQNAASGLVAFPWWRYIDTHHPT